MPCLIYLFLTIVLMSFGCKSSKRTVSNTQNTNAFAPLSIKADESDSGDEPLVNLEDTDSNIDESSLKAYPN